MGISHVAPWRGRRVEPALAPEKRGPTQWGGPAESSVPVRARQSAMPETDGRAVVRGKARFTHDMTFFHHDVRRKRFSTHGKLHIAWKLPSAKTTQRRSPGRGGASGGMDAHVLVNGCQATA